MAGANNGGAQAPTTGSPSGFATPSIPTPGFGAPASGVSAPITAPAFGAKPTGPAQSFPAL
jgi:hypothetical protein